MTSQIVLLEKENHSAFLSCIMPEVHDRLSDPVVFGFGILAGEPDEPEAPAGAIVAEYDAGTVTVLSVGVLPRFQRRGLGSRLVEQLADACVRRHHIELAASCWAADDQLSPIESFFADNGFEVLQGEAVRYAVTVGDIAGSPLERHITRASGDHSMTLVTLRQVSDAALLRFTQDFELPVSIFANADATTSCMTVVNGEVISAVLLSIPQDGAVEVLYLCSKSADGRAAATVLLTSLGKLYRTMPADTLVLFTPMGDAVVKLAEKLLEGCKVEVLHERLLYRALMPMWVGEPVPGQAVYDDELEGE